MRFLERQRRHPPAVIIVPLVDVLLVLLLFLMVTTTFRRQPAIKLTLPESRQGNEGAADNERILITIARTPPYFYLGREAIALDQLQAELSSRASRDPEAPVAVRTDTDTPVGKFINVIDAVKAAGFRRPVGVFTRKGETPER